MNWLITIWYSHQMKFSVCLLLLVNVWQGSAQTPGDEDSPVTPECTCPPASPPVTCPSVVTCPPESLAPLNHHPLHHLHLVRQHYACLIPRPFFPTYSSKNNRWWALAVDIINKKYHTLPVIHALVKMTSGYTKRGAWWWRSCSEIAITIHINGQTLKWPKQTTVSPDSNCYNMNTAL